MTYLHPYQNSPWLQQPVRQRKPYGFWTFLTFAGTVGATVASAATPWAIIPAWAFSIACTIFAIFMIADRATNGGGIGTPVALLLLSSLGAGVATQIGLQVHLNECEYMVQEDCWEHSHDCEEFTDCEWYDAETDEWHEAPPQEKTGSNTTEDF